MATVEVTINGKTVTASPAVTVAVLLLESGESHFRSSVTGESRAPLCGMGICYECRVTIDGIAHEKSCRIIVRPGMDILTDGNI